MIEEIRPSYDDIVRGNGELPSRQNEAQDASQAIRTGSVDGLVNEGPMGNRSYRLEGADHPCRILMESMNEGAVTIDTQGTVVYTNRVFADLIGQAPGKTIGSQFSHCVRASDRLQFDALLRESSRQITRRELSILSGTGESIPVQLSSCHMPLLPGDFYFLVVTDLRGPRWQAQARQSKERLQLAADLAGVGFIQIDYERDFAILDEKAAELFGLTPRVAIPHSEIHARYHPDDRAQIMRLMNQCLKSAGNRSFEMEHRIVHTDGSVRWLSGKTQRSFGKTDGVNRSLTVLWAVLDVTARKRSDAAREDSELRLRALDERSRDVFWVTNPTSKKVMYVSHVFAEVWGRSPQDLYDRFETWIDAIHKDDQSRVVSDFFANIHTGMYDVEYRVVRPDGSIRWVRDRGKPLGVDGLAAGVAEDITEWKQAEEALHQSEMRLRLALDSADLANWDIDLMTGEAFCNRRPAFM